jgi:hypothetical protein
MREDREEDRRQNSDDRDDNEKLDEGKTSSPGRPCCLNGDLARVRHRSLPPVSVSLDVPAREGTAANVSWLIDWRFDVSG